MTTIVNSPGGQESSGMGVVTGVIIALVIVVAAIAFYIYALPAIRNNQTPKSNTLDINVTLPTNINPVPTNTSAPAN